MSYIQRSSKFLSSITTFFVSLNLYYISCFRAAAIARNLLEDDSTWERVMREAVEFQIPAELRQLYVDICCQCSPTNALNLFENNLLHLSEDYIRSGHNAGITKNLSLKSIQDGMKINGRTLEEFKLLLLDFLLTKTGRLRW